MSKSAQTDDTEIIPIFPLSGAILLPGGQLPLNIFEPRYLTMVEDALKTDSRVIGMIQPQKQDGLYDTGCTGRITTFHETEDGRYLITLSGISRFRAVEELEMSHGYRRVLADYSNYGADKNSVKEDAEMVDHDWESLCSQLRNYFISQDMQCDWDMVENTSRPELLTLLCMVCPFAPSEKQALLEAATEADRFEMFRKIIDMALQSESYHCKGMQ
tara:strand:- start:1600 stop:2247 length:648 start_codon:yes stop_codon:yes gene_type:complete